MYDEKLAFYYDMMYAGKDYQKEAQFVGDLLAEGGTVTKLLDVGCGTAEHLRFMALADRSLHIVGVDHSLPMIICAQEKEELSLQTTFIHGDVADVEGFDFDGAISMFNVVNHIDTLFELQKFFTNIRQKIKFGSRFVFDCWNGVAATRSSPRKDARIKALTAGKQIVVEYKPDIDLMNSTVNMLNQARVIDMKGNVLDEFNYELLHTLWTPKVLSEALNLSGFNVVGIYKGSYEGKANAGPDDYKIIFASEAV